MSDDVFGTSNVVRFKKINKWVRLVDLKHQAFSVYKSGKLRVGDLIEVLPVISVINSHN